MKFNCSTCKAGTKFRPNYTPVNASQKPDFPIAISLLQIIYYLDCNLRLHTWF